MSDILPLVLRLRSALEMGDETQIDTLRMGISDALSVLENLREDDMADAARFRILMSDRVEVVYQGANKVMVHAPQHGVGFGEGEYALRQGLDDMMRKSAARNILAHDIDDDATLYESQD